MLHSRTITGRGGFLLLILLVTVNVVAAQEPPPRPIAVYVNPAQGLIFGAFFQGLSGGTVIIYPDGSRSVTGSITQANLGYPFSPAIFEIVANRGTLVSILNGPDVLLTGSNGGTLSLHVGAASTGSSFVTSATPPAQNTVKIGGTLTVGSPAANPSGSYSGIFTVTFIQE
ncbi:DUF4402 domain-containing protein [Chitinophaga qingshengii]|uniref:DUF4402 domain-containing protein n=1 Tax=Chitinophaga qingshengii TaxID=1569794 RepID=A0ABR7TJB7_9BACT|nr:DUF4402 domain-containing protein [Chitinophaga qingshengii]MBC9930577.1 DUF4402 domain-containing protein [Chitinophaga qingshengii]